MYVGTICLFDIKFVNIFSTSNEILNQKDQKNIKSNQNIALTLKSLKTLKKVCGKRPKEKFPYARFAVYRLNKSLVNGLMTSYLHIILGYHMLLSSH